ncbi:MAG: class I SAM-dependent methyltransferase [Chloroflexota bacterium]
MKILNNIRRRFLKPNLKTLSSLDAYAKWATVYPAEAHNTLMEIEQGSMLSLMPDLSGKIVLDLACGTGRYTLIAQEKGAQKIISLDNSMAMLQQCASPNITCATTSAIPLPTASIDVILCGMALGHLPTIETTLSEIGRILKPNGTLLLSDFHPYQYLSGARRTFTDGNQTYEVEHYVHHISDYVTIAQANHLHLTALDEPIYQDNVPVVAVFKFHHE